MPTIEKIVSGILTKELIIKAEKITPNTQFRNNLEADSLDMIHLVTEFEDRFGIQISDEEIEGILTVGDTVTLKFANQLAT